MQWQSRRQSKRGIKLYEELYKLLSMIGLESALVCEEETVHLRCSVLHFDPFNWPWSGIYMSFHLLPFVFTVVSWEEKEPMH